MVGVFGFVVSCYIFNTYEGLEGLYHFTRGRFQLLPLVCPFWRVRGWNIGMISKPVFINLYHLFTAKLLFLEPIHVTPWLQCPGRSNLYVMFLHAMVLQSTKHTNNWLVKHLKAKSSGWLASMLLISRTDKVGRDDPWLFLLLRRAASQKKDKVLITGSVV